jgi:hypothetical protein
MFTAACPVNPQGTLKMNALPMLRGLATFVPGVSALHKLLTHTGGTDSAAYCYSVWMRHLAYGYEGGLCKTIPKTVAELGPGDSIGVGIAALLCGAETYYGLDALPLANLSRNISVLNGLVELFQRRAPISDGKGDPPLPTKLIKFDESRISLIRESILNPTGSGSLIRYVAPWWNSHQIERNSIDLIFSTAVLEHVEDLTQTYRAMREWISPAGWTSHQIDFRCHGISSEWNAHWTCSDWLWFLAKGRRSFFLNRQPHSIHTKMHAEHGFKILVDRRMDGPPISRQRLAKRFQHLTDSDLSTMGALIQARAA